MRRLRLLISSGPTREAIDPVRFLSNRSSGKMGHALARAALDAGQRVTLVSGPVCLAAPRGARVVAVETAREMRRAMLRHLSGADVVIMAAAVADYEVRHAAKQKIKKTRAPLRLRLAPTPDILNEIGRQRDPRQLLVGFAAETARLLPRARAKLLAKRADFIVANRVGRKGTGFESDHNEATLLGSDGTVLRLPRMTKRRLARRLIGIFLRQLSGRRI